MPVSTANSKIVFDALEGGRRPPDLRAAGNVARPLDPLADDDPDVTLVRLAKEEEGVGISMGAHLAGVKSAMLMQNHGFLASVNGIVSGAQLYPHSAADVDQRSRHVRRSATRGRPRAARSPSRARARCAFRSCVSTIRRASRIAFARRKRSPTRRIKPGGVAADARSDVGGRVTRIDALACRLRSPRALRRRHDHGRGGGGAAVDRSSTEFLLPAARDGPRLVGGSRHRAEPSRRAGRGVRRRRFGVDEPRRPDDAGALPPGEPAARGVRQRVAALGRRVSDGDLDRHATSRRSRRQPASRARLR